MACRCSSASSTSTNARSRSIKKFGFEDTGRATGGTSIPRRMMVRPVPRPDRRPGSRNQRPVMKAAPATMAMPRALMRTGGTSSRNDRLCRAALPVEAASRRSQPRRPFMVRCLPPFWPRSFCSPAVRHRMTAGRYRTRSTAGSPWRSTIRRPPLSRQQLGGELDQSPAATLATRRSCCGRGSRPTGRDAAASRRWAACLRERPAGRSADPASRALRYFQPLNFPPDNQPPTVDFSFQGCRIGWID